MRHGIRGHGVVRLPGRDTSWEFMGVFSFPRHDREMRLGRQLHHHTGEGGRCGHCAESGRCIHTTIGNALAAFSSLAAHSDAAPVRVTTGKWGCGIFGGDPPQKMLQQILAAHVAGVLLDFSTFSDAAQCDVILRIIRSRPSLTAAQLWEAMKAFGSSGLRQLTPQKFEELLGTSISTCSD